MSTGPEMKAIGISLEGKYILLDDDTTLPIVSMLDARGDDTNDCAMCVCVLFERPDGMFSGVLMEEFEDEHIIRGNA